MFLQLLLLLLLLMIFSSKNFGFSPPYAVMADIGPVVECFYQPQFAIARVKIYASIHVSISKMCRIKS